MAKATKSLGLKTAPGTPVDVAYLTLEEACAALVTLINGRPTIPALEEIRAIVARHRAETPAARNEKEADRQLVAFGATFDGLAAAMERVPEDDDIPEELTVGLADAAEQIEALPAVSRAGWRIKERVAAYYKSVGASDIEHAVRASLLRDLLAAA